MKKIIFTTSLQNPRGFTLVELLISMVIFTSVITIATGALFSAQTINTRLEQTQLILDGVNLAVEVMARDIRYGSEFHCDTVIPASSIPMTRTSCPYANGGTVIILRPSVVLSGSNDQASDRIMYYLSNGIVYKDEYKEGVIGNKITYQVTPTDVNITTLAFYVTGSENTSAGNIVQPLVTLVLSGVTVPGKTKVTPVQFTIQTSVSARALDI